MKILQIAVLVVSTLYIACAQTIKTEGEWLQQNVEELASETSLNFSAINKAIGDARIVAIGESTHGLGTYYKFKSELVQYLHKEMNFEILAMEGGLGDIMLAYQDIDKLTAIELRDHSLFGNFRANEANAMFQHIKEVSRTEHPLTYVGYDTQTSSECFSSKLQSILKRYDKTLADSLNVRMYSYQKSYGAGYSGDSLNYVKHRDIFVNTATTAKSILENNKTEIIAENDLSSLSFDIMTRTLSMFARSVDRPFSEWSNGIALRDKLMAENLNWLLEEVYPEKKFIIWAHNAHVENANTLDGSIKFMGHFLKEKYGDDYYALGLFAYQGEAYQFWTQKNIPFDNSGVTHIEKKLANTGNQIAFLNLRDIRKSDATKILFNPVSAYELENGGIIEFIPTNRFDGIISFSKGTPPTYK